jgi:hypothetical protein
MISKDLCLKDIKSLRAKHAIERSDENVIAAVHLMNTHGVDLNAALDQSSPCGNDHGVDAWYYDETKKKLYVYQSKLSESKTTTLSGFGDLDRAREWLEGVIIDGTVATIPNDNPCLFNLYTTLSRVRTTLQRVEFWLVSLFSKNELEDFTEYSEFERGLAKSLLNMFVREKLGGALRADLSEYNLERTVSVPKTYQLVRIPNSRIDLRQNAHLDLAYIPLHSLVELYRIRGNVLFDKNVRLSLVGKKDARERLVHPLEDTLSEISKGNISPNIFPFYHVGVTIAANASTAESNDVLNLEAPSIINGCQTITIANEYLKGLEKTKKSEALDRFNQIKVIAKLVIGTTTEELKEITNANNRQYPIEDWQLFSNEPIHIEIEQTLKDAGVFYERQEGKFDAVMKNADNAKYYFNTNGTYIKVVDLGQVVALARRELQWAAKPSEIFWNKQNHDEVFDSAILKYPKDIVFCTNIQKAIKRGLIVYLEQPTLANSIAPKIFQKPLIRAFLSRLALLYYYQNPDREWVRRDFSTKLFKKASPILVDEMQKFYLKVVSKTKNWYTDESKGLTSEVSKRNMDSFFGGLEIGLGIDGVSGSIPFSGSSIDWTQYNEN